VPDSITFSNIPIGLRTPGAYVTVDGSRAVNALPTIPRKLLLMGQRLSTGTVAAGTPIRINQSDEAAEYFGRGSMLHRMAIRARDASELVDIWAIALNDAGAGVAATGILKIVGPATASGVLRVYIAGQRVAVAVTSGDTAVTVATRLTDAITANTDLPVTAARVGATITLTCRWKGETGNDIDIRLNYYQGEKTPAGLTVSLMGAYTLTDACGSDTDWTLGSGWALDTTGGNSEFDKTAGPAAALTRNNITGLTVGQTYRLKITSANCTTGSFAIKQGSTVLLDALSANQAHYVFFTATATSHNITILADDEFDGSILDLAVDEPWAGGTLGTGAGTAGDGNPDVTNTLAALAGEWFYSWIVPYTDEANLALIEAELADRWGPLDPRPGQAFTCLSDTHTNLTTWGETHNSIHVCTLGVQGSPTPSYEIAATWGAAIDKKAANTDPLYPFVGLEIPGMLAPVVNERWTQIERNGLYSSGISGFTVDQGGLCRVDLTITNYQINSAGLEDTAFLLLNHKWGADYLRFAVRDFAATTWAGFKIARDGTRFDAGQQITTPSLMTGSFYALFRRLEGVGMVQDFDQFKRDFRIAISENDPTRVNAIVPPKMLSPLHIIAAALQFRL
jgi:phage tail sheath gpL-like